MHTCAGCGLRISEIARSGPPAPGYERVNERAYEQAIGRVRQDQARMVVSFVRRHAPPGDCWLDVGCGYGYLLREARQAGFQVAGWEPDPRAAAEARKILGDGVVREGVMDRNSAPDSAAAAISTLDVLEHVPVSEMAGFAGLIRSKLMPGGLWVIKVPSTDGLYFTLAHLAPSLTPHGVLRRLWQSDYAFPHTAYFNARTLQCFLEHHQFQMLARQYIADVPNSTVMDRLRMDDSIPAWQIPMLAPAFYGINLVEKLRGKSDALVMLARRL